MNRSTGEGISGLVPALLAGLFAVWCGTFAGAATFAGSVAGEAALAVLLLAAGISGGDPLRLGWAGRLLPPALWVAVLGSLVASPVPRAGRVAVTLLPGFLVLPDAVAHCWRSEAARRAGARALSVVVGGVALIAVVAYPRIGSPRPAWPLGHHNLLAAWLAILAPLAVLPARERGPGGRPWRWLGWGAGLAVVFAVAASRSLAGAAALAIEAGIAGVALGSRRQRGWGRTALVGLAGLGSLVLFLQAPRIARLLAGDDLSARARRVYWRGGWQGFLAHPILGWGPGSVPWTAARFLRPEPGVNPPGEVVGELHSLPVHLLYELGATGALLALALVALFAFRRNREQREGIDRPFAAAGLLGLAGAAVAALASASLAVTALPVAVAVAAGASIAGTSAGTAGREAHRRRRMPVLAASLLASCALAPLELARLHYERALVAPAPAAAQRELARAMALDPSFPLYPARLGWLDWQVGDSPRARREGAALVRRAARSAVGVAPFWLLAGGDASTRGDLVRACSLDPLSAFAPFFLAMDAPRVPAASSLAARALLAEPRLAAASFWQDHEALLASALREVLAQEGVDPGWREAFVAAARQERSAGKAGAGAGDLADLSLIIDRDPALALSLYAFRRAPWPVEIPLVEVAGETAQRLASFPAAASLVSTRKAVFDPAEGCGLEEVKPVKP